MKKRALLFILSVFISLNLAAQDSPAPDLKQLNATGKSAYLRVDEVDKLRQNLRYFDEHPVSGKEEQQMLLDTYRAVVNGYLANYHFKQAYGIYQVYLTLKENFLASEKAKAIAETNQNIEDRQRKDVEELASLQKSVNALQADNDSLVSKRKSFKRYFSFGIIALTVVFAFLLLQAGLKLNKIRHDLKAGRERLMIINRIAVLGKLKKGILLTVHSVFAGTRQLTAENLKQIDQLNQLSGEKNSDLTSLRKRMNELSNLTGE